MFNRVNSLAPIMLVAAILLAGCSAEERPPILPIDSIRYWFEDDMLVINVTFTNRADFSPQAPIVAVGVSEWIAADVFDKDPKYDVQDGAFHSRAFFLAAGDYLGRSDRFPPRLYDSASEQWGGIQRTWERLPPVRIQPEQTVSVEFGFWMHNHFVGHEGYFTADIDITANYPDNEDGDQYIRTGCFNHDTPEFYGQPGDRPRCTYYDETGRDTDTGLALWGQEWAAQPQMIHDPPAGIAGAH